MNLSKDSFNTKSELSVNNRIYHYFNLKKAEAQHFPGINRLPCSLKILFENLLRHEDNKTVFTADIRALADWLNTCSSQHEIAYHPTRVLMQDFTGVPAIVDLAAMREALKKLGGDPKHISPLSPVDLVIDHSVMVDHFGNAQALAKNKTLEMTRNHARYEFLRWGQQAFSNFRVVPPGTGICHQVNLEYLAKTIWHSEHDGILYAYPDTLVGTDSHTTMINGLGVLGWGVGGIEAEAAMLGQPISMLLPEVIGFQLIGQLQSGITATDLVLTITEQLRKKGVVGKFIEFFGNGLQHLPVADRATIANMAPEYGATCGFFPIDQATLDYMQLTGRDQETIALVDAYAKAQGLWYDAQTETPIFTDTIVLDLASVEPSLAGPKRPQDRVNLYAVPEAFQAFLKTQNNTHPVLANSTIKEGDIVIAAITSCTNTSNPSVLMAAGLLAKKACELGLQTKPWVKASLAPGSKVVSDYLQKTGLQVYLDQLGFNIVGYGCTTCIGNSGPLPANIAADITENNLVVCSILSGNRNFEGRIHPLVRANWLASPPLVVAYALAGTINCDLTQQAIAHNANGEAIYLKDIWPTPEEIADAVKQVTHHMFTQEYASVFAGDAQWQAIPVCADTTYQWDSASTYIQHPLFFENLTMQPLAIQAIQAAAILAIFGDSITTDHISPAGSIKATSPAGLYLQSQGVTEADFNSYGARRGNHQVMMRGTFANPRIRNEMTPEVEGGVTRYIPTNEILPIYDAAMHYQHNHQALVIIAGKEYGTGSSRDWAAKGTHLLGVKAVIAESFERIHRSNLIGMGVLPLQFNPGETRKTWQLDGSEQITIFIDQQLAVNAILTVHIIRSNKNKNEQKVLCRIDTSTELAYYSNQGILNYVLRQLAT